MELNLVPPFENSMGNSFNQQEIPTDWTESDYFIKLNNKLFWL